MKSSTFQELLRRYQNRIYSYAYYFLRNREDAEDVTQEVFIRCWQSCEATEWKGMLAWMIRVAHNLCIDVKRRRKRTAIQRNNTEAEYLTVLRERNRATTDPELLLQLDQTQQILLDAMEELPDRTRSYLLLHYFQGLTYREIGQITLTNTNTVKVQVHRGKQALKQILAGSLNEQSQKG